MSFRAVLAAAFVAGCASDAASSGVRDLDAATGPRGSGGGEVGASTGSGGEGEPPTGVAGAGGMAASSGESASVSVSTGATALPYAFVFVPEGAFEMGCSPGDSQCATDEKPRHTVVISAFEMGAHEVTLELASSILGTSSDAACSACPATGLDRAAAAQVCAALGGRLPTEAEWEYAARGGTTTRYPCAEDSPTCLDAFAWTASNAPLGPQPVGTRTPNGFGLYDVIGNASEWVADWYAADFYSSSGPTDPQGPAQGSAGVARGGSTSSSAKEARVSRREPGTEASAAALRGVRCAR